MVHRDLKPANVMVGDFGEVYVMDWGLAKVLAEGGPVSVERPEHDTDGDPGEFTTPSSSSRNTKVQTSRNVEADLTQDGAVLGTPAYMPPEQAAGRHPGSRSPRSDVYSLGAILYEMLTLQPPIDKEGGYIAVLMRVAQGEIVPPEQRNPQRARAGKVPREVGGHRHEGAGHRARRTGTAASRHSVWTSSISRKADP